MDKAKPHVPGGRVEDLELPKLFLFIYIIQPFTTLIWLHQGTKIIPEEADIRKETKRHNCPKIFSNFLLLLLFQIKIESLIVNSQCSILDPWFGYINELK